MRSTDLPLDLDLWDVIITVTVGTAGLINVADSNLPPIRAFYRAVQPLPDH